MSESIVKEKNREPIKTVESADPPIGARREDARKFTRRSVESEKIRDLGISSTEIATNAVTKSKMADDAVGINELDYETADITITGTSTSGTATVTSGSVPIGYFLTAFTTPAASYVQLVVSGTTLTVTLSAAPGASNSITIRVVLLKS